MFSRTQHALLVLWYLAVQQQHVTECRDIILEVQNVTCEKYTNHLRCIECHFVKLATNSYGITTQIIFDNDMGRSFKSRISVDIMPINSKQIIHMADIRFNVCVFLKQMVNNQVIEALSKEFKRVANLPQSCPFKKNVLYESKNFTLTDKYVPTYLALMNFTFKVELFNKNVIIGMWQIDGGTRARKNKN
ncbi:uncharacterized protein LOC133323086 [Musca vetustissima]|uniref:uncharacterized protein LOC133323086 n=1 Tax=Musca vetustissima TaxID=27455 RepID=UPI002AB7F19F|nr:uncharacterized protein LOC133323086 [Musca vetustissima]